MPLGITFTNLSLLGNNSFIGVLQLFLTIVSANISGNCNKNILNIEKKKTNNSKI